jgi:hypothetical protein
MNQENIMFSDQGEKNLARYGAVLLGIHRRLAMEGYFLAGGRIWNIFKAGAIIGEGEWVDTY